MKIGINKIHIFLFSLAILLSIFSHKLTDLKKDFSRREVLCGKLSFSSDPEGYYKKTLKNTNNSESGWKVGKQFGTANQPLISGESAILVELNTSKVLYEKNSTQKMKIASITKIMTAVVALEHKNLDDKIYVSRHAAYVGEDTMYLTREEIYTLKELLYGLMLNSGNDAAFAIAEGVAGDAETFVKWMNIKAKELGLSDTYFVDPSGLDDNTYSTTQDLVKLAKYAMKNQNFKEIVAARNIELNSDTHKYLYLENETNLLTSYPGVAGIKTGYTEEAGLCLVTYATNGGHELVGVVLKSLDRKGDMILMLDYGFRTVGVDLGSHI